MEVTINIFLGVISGVITTVLLALAHKLFWKSFVPWFQEVRYQGADVSGTWTHDFESDGTQELLRTKFSLSLQQSAHNLSGSLHFEFKNNIKNFSVDFDVYGEYWEGYFMLTCKSKDRKIFSRASMLMKLVQGGSSMQGHFTFRNVTQDVPDTIPLLLLRN